jgi:general L-amino acid transport system substrate-binding protein
MKLLAVLAGFALIAVACERDEAAVDEPAAQQEGALLQEVLDRGVLRCGVNQDVPGFGFLDPDTGEIDGFDPEFCRAFAAAIFGEAEGNYELVPVTADDRFSALRAGEYDVLTRNTTWTASRDGAEGSAFLHPNFYDGQAMMVEAGAFNSISEMDGTAVCVLTGTTTELNLEDVFAAEGLDYERVGFDETPQIQEAFIQGRCEGWTTDRSQAAAIRSEWPEEQGGPEALEILDDIMSKEPLAPTVLDGDHEFHQALNWVVFGVILAEELGVDSNNVDQIANDPPTGEHANLLGAAFEGGEAPDFGLGLDNTFMQNVLREVGNYGEIFERHIGADTPLGLDRGLNALWTEGGIQYAMPFR